MTHLWSRMVTAVHNRYRTTAGKRFSRFAVAAVAAVAASQLILALCLGVAGWTAGKSALAAWVAGAGTSYVVSRWAWERRGRPHLLKETLPFWIVAVCAAVVLTTTTKIANQRALALGLTHTQKLIFVGTAYFAANCVTFVIRFVIFHYVLFKDRRAQTAASAATAEAAAGPGGPVPSAAGGLGDQAGGGPAPVNGSAARVNGSSAWAASGGGRSRRHGPATEPGSLPEPETQR
jgi:putative flippase GtrA